eukprot:11874302-Karenia_brevis.AAC.1
MAGMQRVVADMETSPVVSTEVIAAAKIQMEKLFSNLTALAQQAVQQANARSQAPVQSHAA